MHSRTNLIVSHGGRTGTGGTYLRGTKVPPKASTQIPNRHLTGNSTEAWAGAQAPPTPPKAPPALKRPASNANEAPFAKGTPEAAALREATKPKVGAPKPPKPPKPPKASEVVAPEAPPPPPPRPDPPASKRRLTLMRQDDLVALATAYGLDASGRARDVRARLMGHFFPTSKKATPPPPPPPPARDEAKPAEDSASDAAAEE